MIIDFHTHAFPEKIAKPTIEKQLTAMSTARKSDSDFLKFFFIFQNSFIIISTIFIVP